MKLLKKKSKQTFKNKNGVEKHYYNYVLQLDNGKQIQVRPSFDGDYKTLDAVAEYVG